MRLRRACTPEGASANPKSRRWSAKKKQAQENVGPWPHTGSMATKGFLALVLCGVACGPVALVRSAAPASAPTTAVSTDTTHHDRRTAQIASATAVEVTTLLLTSDSGHLDNLEHLVAAKITDARMPRKPGPAPTTVTAYDATVSPSDPSLWQVTVVTMGGQSGSGQAWSVPVHVDSNGKAIALRLPGQIPMPAPASAPTLDTSELRTADPAVQASSGFLTAMLTGNTDLSRWSSPGTAFTAVDPAPCVSVKTTHVVGPDEVPTPSDRQKITVTVTVTCQLTGDESTTRTSQYGLTLVSRAGRWEVASLDQPSRLLPLAGTPVPSSPSVPGPSRSAS